MGADIACEGLDVSTRYLNLYNPTSKIAAHIENYDDAAVSPEGVNLWRHNTKRMMLESKNRGTPWLNYDGTVQFASAFSGYSGDFTANSLLLVGDSRTYMWSTMAPTAFSSYALLDNRGVPGDTARNQQTALQTWGIGKYEKAVISIGINDWMHGSSSTVESLINIVAYIKQRANSVWLTTLPGVNSNLTTVTGVPAETVWEMLQQSIQVNAFVQTICVNAGINFIDLSGLLNNADGTLKAAYDDGGGIHFNSAGYTAIRSLYTSKGI